MRLLALLACVPLAACASPSGSGDDTPGPDGGNGNGSGSASDDRLYPLEVGRTWSYTVTSTYSSCPAGAKTMRVMSASTTAGRATYDVQGFCGLTGHTSVADDLVEEYYDWGPTGWMRSLDEPVSDGHTWQTTNGSATFGMTYANVGTMGAYSDCWKVTQQVQYTTYWIYCRGTGLVKYEMVDLAGGTIRAELTGTSF